MRRRQPECPRETHAWWPDSGIPIVVRASIRSAHQPVTKVTAGTLPASWRAMVSGMRRRQSDEAASVSSASSFTEEIGRTP